jgi:hypothetical protein
MIWPQPQVMAYHPGLVGEVVENQAIRPLKQPKKDKVRQKSPPRPKVVYSSNCGQIRRMAYSLGASKYEAELLVYISSHESSCGRARQNPTSSAHGAFQWMITSFADNCTGSRYSDLDQTRCSLKMVRKGFAVQCGTWWNWWGGKYDHRYGYCKN